MFVVYVYVYEFAKIPVEKSQNKTFYLPQLSSLLFSYP